MEEDSVAGACVCMEESVNTSASIAFFFKPRFKVLHVYGLL